MRSVLLLLILTSVLGCSKAPTPVPADPFQKEIAIVDEYLQALALLASLPTAEDVKKAAPEVERQRPTFEAAMVTLLNAKDPRAPGRLVFSQVVQISAFIEADSLLGRATGKFFGTDVQPTNIGGQLLYAPNDLYFWWTKTGSAAEYSLLKDWEASEIAQKTVIPMYRRLDEQPRKLPRDPAAP
ncbi:MAG TPA: hypothetical protein VK934_10870 [Fimbriimonas sp.]|nr:hypothetical protein [Fimbriimonas sp.]